MFAAGACRTRVWKKLRKRYTTPKEAEEKLALPQNGQKSTEGKNGGTDVVSTPPSDVTADTTSLPVPGPSYAFQQSSDEDRRLGSSFYSLPPTEQIEVLPQQLCALALNVAHVEIPPDYLTLSIAAMERLQKCGRGNVLYGLAKGVGTMREDGSDSVIPTTRMPMGLLEHTVNFFTTREIKTESHTVNLVCNIFHTLLYIADQGAR